MTPKETSLKDVRKNPKLLSRFIKEHPSRSIGNRFKRLLEATAQGALEDGGTSDLDASAGSSGTQTRRGT